LERPFAPLVEFTITPKVVITPYVLTAQDKTNGSGAGSVKVYPTPATQKSDHVQPVARTTIPEAGTTFLRSTMEVLRGRAIGDGAISAKDSTGEEVKGSARQAVPTMTTKAATILSLLMAIQPEARTSGAGATNV
jgi:hypothetical protein